MLEIFFFIVGVLILCFFKDAVSICVIAVTFLIALVINRKAVNIRKAFVFLLMLCMGMTYFYIADKYISQNYGNIATENESLTVLVISEPETEDERIIFTGKIKEYDNKKAEITIQTDKTPMYRDIIMINGNVESIDKSDNVYEFNSREYYYSNGIFLKVKSKDDYELIERKKDFFTLLNSFKNKLTYIIDMNFSFDSGNLMKGIILGDEANRSKELDDALVKTGLSHIVVVSGMHFSIINMYLVSFLRRLRIGRKASSFISIPLAVVLGIFVGFSASVVRALIMLIILNIADLIARDRVTDIHSVMVTALIMILGNPFLVYNAGFILSFASVSGIILFNSKISGLIKLPGKYLKESISVSLSANILTLPFVIYYFKGIPINFIVSNILMGIFVPVIMLYGVMVFLFSFVNMKLGYFIGLPLDYILKLNIKLVMLISKIPYGYIKTLGIERYLITLYFSGIYLITALKLKAFKIILPSLAFAFFILSLFVNIEGTIFNFAAVYAFCGKDGGKVFISCKGHNLFIDLSVENEINYGDFIEEKFKGDIDLCVLGSAFAINNAKNRELVADTLYYPKTAYERESIRGYIRSFKAAVPIDDKINIKYNDIDLTLSVGKSYNISEAVIRIKDETIIITNDFYTDFNSDYSYIITGKMMEVYSFENILNCDKKEIERIKI